MAKKRFFWSSVLDCVLQEQDGAGQTEVTYTHEPSLYGPLVSEHRGGQASQYHFDALGSTRALTDDSQTVTDTFAYDAWGNSEQPSASGALRFLWVGVVGYSVEFGVVGSVYVRHRTYTPQTGRWKSMDPLAFLFANSSASQYSYSSNAPTLMLDPSGLVPDCGERLCGPEVPIPFGKDVPNFSYGSIDGALFCCVDSKNPVEYRSCANRISQIDTLQSHCERLFAISWYGLRERSGSALCDMCDASKDALERIEGESLACPCGCPGPEIRCHFGIRLSSFTKTNPTTSWKCCYLTCRFCYKCVRGSRGDTCGCSRYGCSCEPF